MLLAHSTSILLRDYHGIAVSKRVILVFFLLVIGLRILIRGRILSASRGRGDDGFCCQRARRRRRPGRFGRRAAATATAIRGQAQTSHPYDGGSWACGRGCFFSFSLFGRHCGLVRLVSIHLCDIIAGNENRERIDFGTYCGRDGLALRRRRLSRCPRQ